MKPIPFLSICIPSYNRPIELRRLLASIPLSASAEIEIIIAEDKSPKREEVRNVAAEFHRQGVFEVRYIENSSNLGYDGNLRSLAKLARGTYIMYMGDDDTIETANLEVFLRFIKDNSDCAYVMKCHSFVHDSGVVEPFRYYTGSRRFPPGFSAFKELFRKSVFVSGFCFKRVEAEPFHTDCFDGTLLYQLYLLSELVLQYPSAYCDTPLTIQSARLRGIPMFGSSEREEKLYTPGKITVDNSVNFMKGYFKMAAYIDAKYSLGAVDFLRRDFSKYSYPVIAIQRWRGVREFRKYCLRLEKNIGINETIYYYIYYWALICFGKKICDMLIVVIKRILGSTPRL